jgi:hypothetical protein
VEIRTMDPDPHPAPNVTTITYDVGSPTVVRSEGWEHAAQLVYAPQPVHSTAPSFGFEHDREKGVFRLTGPDGTIEYFRDKPIRQLVVQPDPETGEMTPVLKAGKPTNLYLCREEREVR